MMNRTNLLIFLVFIIQYALDGQSTSVKIDSMLNALPEKRDSNRVKALNAVFWEATSQDISLSGEIIKEQLSLSKELEDQKLIAGSTSSLGVYYYYISEIDSAIWAVLKRLEKIIDFSMRLWGGKKSTKIEPRATRGPILIIGAQPPWDQAREAAANYQRNRGKTRNKDR